MSKLTNRELPEDPLELLGTSDPLPDFKPSQNSVNLRKFAAETSPELLDALNAHAGKCQNEIPENKH